MWGNLPFDKGDFWTHALLDLLYPGYEKASYFHDESGFLAPTPYGDSVDVVLSDAPLWLLRQYPVIVVGSKLRAMRAETAAKLSMYVRGGGLLVATADALESPILGVSAASCTTPLEANMTVQVTALQTGALSAITEAVPLLVCALTTPVGAQPVATVTSGGTKHLLAVRAAHGNGTLLALATSGIASLPQVKLPLRGGDYTDEALPSPYPMATHVHALLGELLESQTPFFAQAAADRESAGALSVVASRVSPGSYLLSVSNSGLRQQPMNITSTLGEVTSVDEVVLDDAKLAVGPPYYSGYLPTSAPPTTNLGTSSASTIAGLDQRLFRVSVQESSTTLLPESRPSASAAHRRLALPLDGSRSVQEQLMLRPTFRQHFQTAVVDWRYVERTESADLAAEGRWALRQNISLAVDFVSLCKSNPWASGSGQALFEVGYPNGLHNGCGARMMPCPTCTSPLVVPETS